MPRSVDPGPNVLTNTSVLWICELSSVNGDYWGFCGIVGIWYWLFGVSPFVGHPPLAFGIAPPYVFDEGGVAFAWDNGGDEFVA